MGVSLSLMKAGSGLMIAGQRNWNDISKWSCVKLMGYIAAQGPTLFQTLRSDEEAIQQGVQERSVANRTTSSRT